MAQELHWDFRLLDLGLELDTLEAHMNMIEEHIEQEAKSAKLKRDSKMQEFEAALCDAEPDDQAGWLGEMNLADLEHDHYVEFVLPRIFRNPFLVSLYSVYESAVTEIADLVQKKLGRKPFNKRQRGKFLDRIKEYYEATLDFQLSTNHQAWGRLGNLSHLRNAIAHGNGRVGLDIVWQETREGIQELLKNKEPEVKERFGYIIVRGDFLSKTYTLVKGDLDDLIDRYKKWDDIHGESSTPQT